jgi:outer membrane murein-binding lipoprotein Lpp
MRKVVLLLMVMAAMLIAGCSEPNVQQDKKQDGMSNKEEDKLNQRIAELEDKVNNQSAEQTTQEAESAEDLARAAAQDYYAAAAGGDYSYTYSNLSAVSQGQFTEDEWVADNTTLGSDAGTYSVNSVEMVDDSTAEVYLTITSADGSSSERFTRFVLENGSWKHELTPDEYELFAGATADSASASAFASASASAAPKANAGADTKHVKVVISSDKPADVSINDDSLNWFVNEEIVGTKTYERDIRENSGLSVSATTQAYRAQTTIEVYEDGALVSQDSDPNGFAMVNY